MKQVAGLWIDHREAVIVTLSDKGQETRRVKSDVGKQLRRSGRSPSEAPFEAHEGRVEEAHREEQTRCARHDVRNERQDDRAPDFAESAPALFAVWRNPAPWQKKQAVTTK